MTLCENCHEAEGIEGITNQKILIEELLKAGVYSSDMNYYGHVIAEGIKSIGYQDIEFLLLRIGINADFREIILSEIKKERNSLNNNDGFDPGF